MLRHEQMVTRHGLLHHRRLDSLLSSCLPQGGQLSSATYTVAILHEYSATHVKEHLVVFPVDASGNPQTTNVPLEIFSYESKTSKGHRKEDQRDYIKIRDSTGQWHRMSVGSRDRAAEVWLAQNIIE